MQNKTKKKTKKQKRTPKSSIVPWIRSANAEYKYAKVFTLSESITKAEGSSVGQESREVREKLHSHIRRISRRSDGDLGVIQRLKISPWIMQARRGHQPRRSCKQVSPGGFRCAALTEVKCLIWVRILGIKGTFIRIFPRHRAFFFCMEWTCA